MLGGPDTGRLAGELSRDFSCHAKALWPEIKWTDESIPNGEDEDVCYKGCGCRSVSRYFAHQL